MIDFTRAFETAWERMLVILFRPFDLGKWCVIGFSAFLAGLIAGGNGVNGSFNTNSFKQHQFQVNASGSANSVAQAQLQLLKQQFSHFFSGMPLWAMVGIFALIFLFLFGLTLLFFWLGARGQFMFLDNIVRNRAAIAWPWQTYARLANSFFLFYVLLEIFAFLILIPILAVAAVICVPLFQHQRWPVGAEIGELVGLGAIYFIFGIVIAIVLFLFRELGVAIMFRQGISARAAFVETLRLVASNPGNITLFLLLRLALFIGTAVICVMLCCVTCCCLYQIPYVGTVFLLPVLIFLRCFTLDCLAQLGPQYDVFTVDVPPPGTPGVHTSINPPPQPG